jgi:hypothetical protein
LVLDFVDALSPRVTTDEKILAEIVIDEASGFSGKSISKIFRPSDGNRCWD